MHAPLTLTIGRRAPIAVVDLADASRCYQRARGTKPSSAFREGIVTDESGVEVARVSYNGRVWPAGPYQPGRTPLMEAVEA